MYFTIGKDRAGEWRWNLKSNNGNIIADSGEGYKNKSDCLHMIQQIKNGAVTAGVREA